MEFCNPVNKQGIVEDILFLCQTTTASYSLNDIVRNVNQAYQDVTRLIWECSDTWQYDDSNKGDIPKVFTDLVAGTHQYSIPSTAQRIHRIEIKDNAGKWNKLEQIDYKDLGVAVPEYLSADALPQYYDLIGNYINLYPGPAAAYITTSSGMAVYVDRDVTLFTSGSTTATPGFAPQFHRILSLEAALDFEQDAIKKNSFKAERNQLIEGLKRFYNSRNVEMKSELMPANKRRQRQYE